MKPAINENSYKSILKQFDKKWLFSDIQEKKELMRTVVRHVISTVEINNTGSIQVHYIADKKLEADWAEIKNANSDGIKVRTSGLLGSPGWIRTSDQSVNSR
jgi:hypothetical protein